MGNPTYKAQDVQIKQLTCFEYVNRMTDLRFSRITMNFLPYGKRKREMPRKTSQDDVDETMRYFGQISA